jgi:hypothetical protein
MYQCPPESLGTPSVQNRRGTGDRTLVNLEGAVEINGVVGRRGGARKRPVPGGGRAGVVVLLLRVVTVWEPLSTATALWINPLTSDVAVNTNKVGIFLRNVLCMAAMFPAPAGTPALEHLEPELGTITSTLNLRETIAKVFVAGLGVAELLVDGEELGGLK